MAVEASLQEFDGVALPTPELRAAAEAQLGETDAVRATALEALRTELLKRVPTDGPLPFDTSDTALVFLLRARSFDVAAAAQLAVNARAFRLKYPELHAISREAILTCAAIGYLQVLPQLGREGHRVITVRPARIDLDRHPVADISPFQMWFAERLKHDPHVQVHGLASLSDYGGMTLTMLVRHFQLLPFKTRLDYQRDVYASRTGLIMLWRLPAFLRAIFLLARGLLPSQMTAHVRLCADGVPGEAAELLDAAHVPRAFGGDMDEAEADAHMLAWTERQLELEALGL